MLFGGDGDASMDTVNFLLFTFDVDRRSEVMTRHFSSLSVEFLRGGSTRCCGSEVCKCRMREDDREDSREKAIEAS